MKAINLKYLPLLGVAVVLVWARFNFAGAGAAGATGTVPDGIQNDGMVGSVSDGSVASVDAEFAEFVIWEAELELDEAEDDDEFEVEGRFALANASDGVNLLSEAVAVEFGAFSHTIAPGLMVRDEDHEGFEFYSTLPSGTRLSMEIGDNGVFEVEVEGLDLGAYDPDGSVDFSLRIGGDFGETTISLVNGQFGDDDDDDFDDDDGNGDR